MITVSASVTHNKLPAIAAAFPGLCQMHLRAEVFELQSDVQANIVRHNAIDTGYMLNSTFGRMLSDTLGEVVVDAYYAGYVNYGTYRMAARPFFTDAVEKSRKRFPKRFKALEAQMAGV